MEQGNVTEPYGEITVKVKTTKEQREKLKVLQEIANKEPVTELTPALAEKIWSSIKKAMYDEKVSKEIVLKHLKQLKAQIGKEKNLWANIERNEAHNQAIDRVMAIIDKKIAKINKR